MSQFAKHQQVKAKCLVCNLHFLLCTWTPDKHATESLYCPECGQHDGLFCLWREDVPAPICTVVPGRAQLCGMGLEFNPKAPDESA